MKIIESADNKSFKNLEKLARKKYRDEGGVYIAEGPNVVGEAIKAGLARQIVLREDIVPEAVPELTFSGKDIPETVKLSEKLFARAAQTETSSGIMAVVRKRQLSREEFIASIRGGNVLVLDRLQDPGNIGTMLRTAAGAGYSGAVIMKGTADVYSPKIVRSAAGVLLRLPLWFADDPGEAVKLLKEAGKTVIGTGPREAVPYYTVPLKKDIALVIGNEGNGMSEEFLAMTDKNIFIPMRGGTESLNAAVAAGILMYKAVEEGQ